MARTLRLPVDWRRARQLIGDLPAWLFLMALIAAPWAYGGATPTTVHFIEKMLGAMVAAWLLAVAVRRKGVAVPPLLLLAAAVALIQGWIAANNPRSLFDPDYQAFIPTAGFRARWPASLDAAMSWEWMVRITLLAAVTCFAADLARRPRWLLRIWMAVGAAAGSVALLGLAEKATGAVMPFWEQPNRQWLAPMFFGSFFYHANAGAFLNLTLPLTAGLAIRAAQRAGAHYQRAIWSAATLLVVISCAVNTSRMAQLLAVGVLISTFVWPARNYLLPTIRRNGKATAAVLGFTLIIIIAIAQVSHIEKPLERWRSQTQEIPNDARWTAQRIALGIASDAGLFGFGPGTFAAAFPHYELAAGMKPEGEWQHLHEDYLQTLIEYGWIGSACAVVVFFGGFISGARALRRTRNFSPSRMKRLLPLILIGLGATAIHALVDFPLQVFSLQLYVATYVGICWGAYRAITHEAQPLAARPR